MGEGVFVLNTQANVVGLYTDGLSGCVQLIMRNAQVTFCGHISSHHGGRMARWAERIGARFRDRYGPPTFIGVCGALDHQGSVISVEREVRPWRNDGSCTSMTYVGGGMVIRRTNEAFDPKNKQDLDDTPSKFNTSRDDIAGSLTAPELIVEIFQIDDRPRNIQLGDYFEGCKACLRLFG